MNHLGLRAFCFLKILLFNKNPALNLLTCADSSTDTKTDRNEQIKEEIKKIKIIERTKTRKTLRGMPKLAIGSTGKRVFRYGTDTQHTTYGHCNLETKSVQWADSVEFLYVFQSFYESYCWNVIENKFT